MRKEATVLLRPLVGPDLEWATRPLVPGNCRIYIAPFLPKPSNKEGVARCAV